MTDEEKIKKARGIICHNCRWNECDNNSCPTLQDTIKAIEVGLAEGRKEGCEVCEKSSMKEYQKLFDKEHKIIGELEKENADLKVKNEDLRTFAETISENHSNEWQKQQQIITELKQQIEKMKCCENCTHSTLNECDNLVCELNQFKFPEDYPCINYSKWECVE